MTKVKKPRAILSYLKWRWRLRNLPTSEQMESHDMHQFNAYVRYHLAMATHRDFLNIRFKDIT